jgi:hypothetical protein
MVTPQQMVTSSALETVISSLRDISSVRVVMDHAGTIEEIHVITDSVRAPKQVVRDIESAIMARFGIELDHKKVSIAQVQNGNPLRFGESRLRFLDVAISMSGAKGEATVRLRRGETVYTGSATGHSSSHNQLRLISTATLRAIENGQGADGRLVLEDVTAGVHLSGRTIVVVLVSMLNSRDDDFLTGSAIVKQDLWKAVVNATLDAVNRRLASLNEE